MSEEEKVNKEAQATQQPGDSAGTASETPATETRQGDEVRAREDGSRGRRRASRQIPAGIAFVKASFNNTIVSFADVRGNVISWSSAGKAGFKGSRKSTAFAATMVAQDAARQAMSKGMHEVEIRLQGAGAGRESAVRAIQSAGINVSAIKDVTPIPHNGCRARKRRRV